MGELLGSVTAKIFMLMGVVVVSALLWNWYSNDRVLSAFQTLQQVRNETWVAYRNQSGRYGTTQIGTATLIALKAFPESQVSGATLVNDWGGTWQVTGAVNDVRIALDNVPAADCIRMATRFQQSSGIKSIRIGASLAAASSATAQTAPLDPGTASTSCNNTVNALDFLISPSL